MKKLPYNHNEETENVGGAKVEVKEIHKLNPTSKIGVKNVTLARRNRDNSINPRRKRWGTSQRRFGETATENTTHIHVKNYYLELKIAPKQLQQPL